MAIETMTKSYIDLIGIFRGKQAKYNKQILSILYDSGPLTAWKITGKIRGTGRISLHATLNKRLRNLKDKGYLQKADKFWLLHFKGIIASLLIQETPKPWSNKWNELIENYAKDIAKKSDVFSGVSFQIHANEHAIIINPSDLIDKNLKTLGTHEDWVALSDYIKELIEKGVINFDVISNYTLGNLLISEASNEQVQAFLKDWNIKKLEKSSFILPRSSSKD